VRRDARLRDAARRGLDAVGLGGRANTDAAALSHGEQRQLEIAMALAGEPRLLLLDEPMAGMGVEESQRLVAFLQSLKSRCGMLLIEHDMDAVFALADRITVLVYGRVLASGTPDEIRAHPEVRQAYLGEETS
jgi:branched-chain amino acid transport system ATP-binding protein